MPEVSSTKVLTTATPGIAYSDVTFFAVDKSDYMPSMGIDSPLTRYMPFRRLIFDHPACGFSESSGKPVQVTKSRENSSQLEYRVARLKSPSYEDGVPESTVYHRNWVRATHCFDGKTSNKTGFAILDCYIRRHDCHIPYDLPDPHLPWEAWTCRTLTHVEPQLDYSFAHREPKTTSQATEMQALPFRGRPSTLEQSSLNLKEEDWDMLDAENL
jgi:hypothetical protein